MAASQLALAVNATTGSWQCLLVLVDDSHAAAKALDEAAALACAIGAELCLLTVFDAVRHASGRGPPGLIEHFISQARERVEDVLRRACARASESGAQARAVVVDGCESDMGMLVEKVAREIRADVVVMGTHGRRGLDRFFLGSVAEAVLRRAPVPVLIVRAHERRQA